MQLILENVRTFDGHHEIPIRPLTILTGENSTGKTSLLAMLSALLNSPGFPLNPDFDDEPYELGGYDTIATYKGGRYGRADYFGMGFKHKEDHEGPLPDKAFASYRSYQGRPELAQLILERHNLYLDLNIEERTASDFKGTVELSFEDDKYTLPVQIPIRRGEAEPFILTTSLLDSLRSEFGPEDEKTPQLGTEVVRALFETIQSIQGQRATSLAPIRTQPNRLYSKTGEGFAPTGEHIPYLLRRLDADPESRSESKRVFEALQEFGKNSGLFDMVGINPLGSKATDPFQVIVRPSGTRMARSLSDVGYGVSQALPVVVQSVLQDGFNTILMQQPEVHLHPRAQAALGTFLCKIARKSHRQYVIETHSDFVVDRIRLETSRDQIAPEDVIILFLERNGYETVVHPLALDEDGNVKDAPDNYRSFFLREEMKMLQRTSQTEHPE